jgi:hypothetical protein
MSTIGASTPAIHILSCVDARDSDVDRVAMSTVRQWERLTSDHVTIGTVIDRAPAPPPRVSWLPFLRRRPHWAGQRAWDMVAKDAAPAAERAWSGTGTRDTDGVVEFLSRNARRYPSALRVLHLEGHGIGFRYVAGLKPAELQSTLAAASPDRRADLLLIESCLSSNLETLMAAAPHATWVVASQDVVSRRGFATILDKTLKGSEAGGAPSSAEALGRKMIEKADGVVTSDFAGDDSPLFHDLSLIRSDAVPALAAAVDRLGGLMAEECKAGHRSIIDEILTQTRRFPGDRRETEMREKLDVGDLGAFAAATRHAFESQAGARRDAIVNSADEVLERLSACVVAHHGKTSGGISVQLPGQGFLAFEREKETRARFFESASPAGWKAFVRSATEGA